MAVTEGCGTLRGLYAFGLGGLVRGGGRCGFAVRILVGRGWQCTLQSPAGAQLPLQGSLLVGGFPAGSVVAGGRRNDASIVPYGGRLAGLPAGAGGSGLAGSERSDRESAAAAAAPATDGSAERVRSPVFRRPKRRRLMGGVAARHARWSGRCGGVQAMGITTGLAGHQAGKGLVALVKQGLIVGGLLVVDQLVGLLEGFQLFPDGPLRPPRRTAFLRNFMAERASAMSCMVRIGGYSCRRRRMRRANDACRSAPDRPCRPP